MEQLRVLVVDDEQGMRMGIVRSLADYVFEIPQVNVRVQFQMDTAESGEQALEKIRTQRPDILLLDHKLPGITGLEVLESLHNPEDLFTVMLTAYASIETAVAAIKKGAFDFLAKPFTPSELKSTVHKVAENLIMMRQARKLAQEKRQMRFQFISVLAHELKAPLGAIEGYLNMLRDKSAGDDPEAYDHMVERCLIRSNHMRKLIMDLLDLTRIESGQNKREPVPLDVREIAQNAIETCTPDAREKQVTIHLQGEENVPLVSDRSEIEIILNNLISNAVKYNRSGGRVDVRLQNEPERVVIQVADTGIGLAPSEAGRLFNEFVRIKNAKTAHILGSGLGLSIVKKLAVLNGGDVQVASQPDVGSTFTVWLSRSMKQETVQNALKKNTKPKEVQPDKTQGKD